MGQKHREEFNSEAVRLARSSGLMRKQVAADLGIGLSTLGKWISTYQPEVPADLPSADLLKKVEQLRRENRVLKETQGSAYRTVGPEQEGHSKTEIDQKTIGDRFPVEATVFFISQK